MFYDTETFILYNHHRDFIEINLFYTNDGIKAYAILTDEKPPFRDFVGYGQSKNSKAKSVKQALKDLYAQAYKNIH